MKKLNIMLGVIFLSFLLSACGSSSLVNNASQGVDLAAVGEISAVK